ncbi:MAG TPA: endolytic transglycosylase MltG [Clostridiales bacterium]|nr:endolytic transglycosylase MltG [Clostridiales bacterium]
MWNRNKNLIEETKMNKKVYIILGVIFAIVLIGVISVFAWYKIGTTAPKNEVNKEIVVEIKSGTSTSEIVKTLKSNNVIRNELVAKMYIKLHKVKGLQAGKYLFNGNDSLSVVIDTISSGKVMDETVTITFKEGKNMRYIASTIAEKTNNTPNDVYNLLKDKDYITSLIDKYWFLSKTIQNENIYYPLEGYLYPDTYSFENKDVDVKTIFEKMLDQMSKVLSKYKKEGQDAQDGETNKNITVHQLLTIASIIELEGNKNEDRAKIASVIYNRIRSNMSLGSDVTTYYGIRVDMGDRDLYAKEINTYNAYNTRGPNMNGKLPIGPIANPSEESITAALNPVNEKYLYFVADKNGDMYFSNTYEEHQNTINTLKKKGLWFEYEN